MLFDLSVCLAISFIAPLVVIGLAVANFIDHSDTMTAILTALAAYLVLELLALWVMEAVVVLAALQFSRVSNRYLHHVERRKALECQNSPSEGDSQAEANQPSLVTA